MPLWREKCGCFSSRVSDFVLCSREAAKPNSIFVGLTVNKTIVLIHHCPLEPPIKCKFLEPASRDFNAAIVGWAGQIHPSNKNGW